MMDIPDLDELEWLESHAQDDDQFDDDFELDVEPPSPPSSPSLDKPPQRPPLSLPPKPSLQLNPISKKRPGSDLSSSISLDETPNHRLNSNGTNGKRSRSGEDESRSDKVAPPDCPGVSEENKEGSGDDEEWLRFSPPRDTIEEMEVVEEEQERILSRFATEIDGDCVPITGLDGERVYAKICTSTEIDEEARNKKLNFRRDNNGLLQEPVRVMMEKVEQEQFAKALQGSFDDDTVEVVPSSAPVTTEKLWVEKYAPSSFTELLSDEKTNREVLLWLKQWDSCVFGSEIKSTTDDVLTSLRRHSTGSHHLKQSSRSFSRNNRETRFNKDMMKADMELDKENNTSPGIQEMWDKKNKSSGPPEQKVLLLCGSPGLGKTTLAHVAASHCGYRVVEINASDDRSASTIEAKILDVVQMNSVIADSKPKCLVVDEIDGALGDGKGAVEIILRLLAAEKKLDTGKENVSQEANTGRKSSGKKQKSSVLLRPVICICNDLYAPALRPLRQVAKVHIFVQPTVSRVANRLKYICNKEGVKASSVALSALAECTECDVRSCLNTLQFLNKKKEMLNVMDISSQVVGRKDATKSAFDVWKEIFQKQRPKSGRRSNNSSNNVSKDFEYLYSLISNRGDSELILDGIHENIFQLHYVDPLMQKTVQCLDNLGVSDVTHQYIMRTQKMSLLVYQPPIAIFIHRLIAQLERKDIQWPKSLQRHRTILAERIDMFHSWHNGISPYISRHLSTKSFVEDSISALLHILSPPSLRPVALHLLSDKERGDLMQLVNTMVSYSMTYKNIKSDQPDTWRREDEATTIALDPPLSNFIHFKDYSSCHIDLALAVKQVLVHEVEKQKILQGSLSKSANLRGEENHALAKNNVGTRPPSKFSFTNGAVEKKTNQKSQAVDKPELPKAVVEVKSVQKTKKPSGSLTSFFSRIKKVGEKGSEATDSDVPKSATSRRDSHPFLFKFNEGYTNAVKRPVKMREFLL
ncbi:chromosome transmission fidelity protein 18 homolog [Salvia hispanica]|uniref:chromosome transmission fidelity protein 18 homolog n=1 Tax=Salvia hispanica TaxID=49212 RepID=UPI0020096D88|nr:chromosome transmission fidelity protein 18 homolog [Salvia hispanica]